MGKKAEDGSLAGREVLLCLTGGIACYKSADLTSKLIQAGAGVTVAMTESAARFVGPLTFQTLTGRGVHTSLWQSTEAYHCQHIALTDLADVMVIAPATANMIGKLSAGLGDDLVSTLALSAWGTCPILLAPAMNTRMWSSPAVQGNVEKLTQWGVYLVGPGEGALACRTEGLGRMAEPAEILQAVRRILSERPPKGRSTGE